MVRLTQIQIYDAMIEAKKDGFLPSEISRCCNHGGTHHGYVFELIWDSLLP